MIDLPITLAAAGAAALLNVWLGWRVGQVRQLHKVSVGDGGNQAVIARMRAHANFVEYTPFVLLLLALIEATRGPERWLWAVAAVFLAGRIAHAFGMDGWRPGRMTGTIVTMLTLVGLGGYAIVLAAR